MTELGRLLREAREQKGLSLADVEEATKIRKKFLQALEAGDTENLPPSPNTRGILRNLATYLGLDPDDVIRRYSAAVPESVSPPPIMISHPLTRRRRIDPEPVAGLVLMVLVVALLTWVIQQYVLPLAQPIPPATVAGQAPTGGVSPPRAEPTGVSSTILPLPTPTGDIMPTPTPLPTPPPTPTPTFVPSEVEIQVNAIAPSWLRVRVDGQEVFQGVLSPGTNQVWVGKERIDLRIGNAGGVELTINGQSIGILGQPGQVLERAWILGPDGQIQPVSPPTPTVISG